jgi:endonuclease/exonuclease/phosphatase family metal-dependent hydrolase
MSSCHHSRMQRIRRVLLWVVVAAVDFHGGSALLAQTTGTFIDRNLSTDLRFVSYNIYQDSIFADTNTTQAAKFARVVQALRPDVLNLQEIYDHTASQTASLLNTILPLGNGATWYALQSFDNILVSKYPLTMTATDTIPEPSATSYAMALVNLPDAQFDTDFYFMDAHFKCCGSTGSSEDLQRQRQADALANWMRDARTPGGFVNLPAGTPMAVAGDLNLVGSPQPLDTLITGNIINEGTYGPDAPPDWDGTSLADAHPLQNASGPDDYTWRNDPSGFSRSRLDYVLYTDSVVGIAKHFVLNTVTMTSAERSATGLQSGDITLTSSNYDHLPVVVDFRFPSEPLPGDYNSDGKVDGADYDAWKLAFGTDNAAADGNGDGRVDAGDYTVWRDNLGAGGAGSGVAAVPEPTGVAILAATWAWGACGRLRRRS